ncbi:MAG: hypothetical protein FJY83_05340 [Candidatus Aminicenantes bacterium]|nr:hypothetical protein [Candidatus Aminicenantes bacterium]
MKKSCLALFLAVSLFALAAPRSEAAGPLNFYVRGGILFDNYTETVLSGLLGANLDINFGALSLSPECDMIIYGFSLNPIIILPGALLNANLGPFFLGAGVNLPLIIGSGDTIEGNLLVKLNAGLKIANFKLQAFLLTPLSDFFDWYILGATFGFGF